MLSENSIIVNSNDIVHIVFIVIVEVLENAQLDACLVLELFLVANDLYRNFLLVLVIITLDSLAKASLAQEFKNFVSVSKMVF